MKEDYQAVLDYAGHGKKVVGFPAAPAIWGLRVGQTQPLATLQVGLRDGLQGLLRLHRESRKGARLRVLEQGGSLEELPVVPGESAEVRGLLRRLAPRALEAGRYRAAQTLFLERFAERTTVQGRGLEASRVGSREPARQVPPKPENLNT